MTMFDDDTRARVLLWCDRRCCVCRGPSRPDLDVVAIEPAGPADETNALPVCPSCRDHLATDGAPGPEELRLRREQVYEECTRHLVPPVVFELTQDLPESGSRRFPDVGFLVAHRGDSLPVRLRLRIVDDATGVTLPLPPPYAGERPWNLNPGLTVRSHFELPEGYRDLGGNLTLRVEAAVLDSLGREHPFLPVRFTYVPYANYWQVEP